jgi:hypothetical protein
MAAAEQQQLQRHSDLEQLPLSELYDEAARLADAAGADRASAALERAVAALLRCEAAAERAALFSSNEDADDIPTSSLKFLLLPSMRAELLAWAPCAGGPEQRARHVGAALAALREFLGHAAQYGILKGAAAEAAGLGAWGHGGRGVGGGEEEDGEGRGNQGGGAVALRRSGASTSSMDPNARRQAKIERFKRSRALAAAAEQLRRQREEARRRGGGGADDAGGGETQTGGPGGWDEEDERRLWLMRIEAAALSGIDVRDSLLQEAQLLQHAIAAARQREAEDGPRSESGRGASTSSGGGGAAGRDARMRPGARRSAPGGGGGSGGSGGFAAGGGMAEGGDAASRAAMMTRLSGIAEALTLNGRERIHQQVERSAPRSMRRMCACTRHASRGMRTHAGTRACPRGAVPSQAACGRAAAPGP